MSYATAADMQARFSESDLILLTDLDGENDAIDETVLAQALEDASAEINGYLGGRYQLPLTKVPSVLNRLCCDIARFLLSGERAPEVIENRYQNAVKFLRSVGKGELSLGIDDSGDTATTQNLAQLSSAGSVFGRAQSKGFL